MKKKWSYWKKKKSWNTDLSISRGSILWFITPCSPLKINQRFEGTCGLRLHGQTISQVRNHHEADRKKCVCNCSSFASVINYVHPKLKAWMLQYNKLTLFYKFSFSVRATINNEVTAFALLTPYKAHITTPANTFMGGTHFLYPLTAHIPPPP
jgi:hypothetical protein